MSGAVDLMQAILGPDTTEAAARSALTEAHLVEADPMQWAALHRHIAEAEVMRRAAIWADLAFFDVLPRHSVPPLVPARLESLAEVRLFRLPLLDRHVAYAAPDFGGVLRLAAARAKRPEISRDLCLVPPAALRDLLVAAAGEALVDGARQNLARKWPRAVAQLELTRPVRWGAALLLLALAVLLVAAPLTGQVWLAPLWITLAAMPAMLRCVALAAPPPETLQADPIGVDPVAWPLYSVLVPLCNEANMVEQLFRVLGRLDYPPGRLEILFVVESRSVATIAAVRSRLGDPRFGIVEVPDALPRTKPKALDFALPLCRGDYVVVYDAEDRPDPDQLRRVVTQFRRQPAIECIQARLVITNGRRGWLQALFAGEYAGLFTVVLPALAQWGLVTPLGGTSNHFRLASLRRLGGWDAYNVTEDADLGVRLARRKLRTAVSVSRTLEDAPASFRAWLGQRTRWMKGWTQTFVVHNRRPDMLVADLGLRGAIMFQVVVLGMLLAPLLHAGFLLALFAQHRMGLLDWPRFGIWPLACILLLILGYGAALATNLVGLGRTGQRHLRLAQLLVPLYWLLIAWATLRALVDFARRPFHWFKTPHHATKRFD